MHCNFLNVNELLAQSRRDIWKLSDYNRICTHNHSVLKVTFNHSAKLTNYCRFDSRCSHITVQMFSMKHCSAHKVCFLNMEYRKTDDNVRHKWTSSFRHSASLITAQTGILYLLYFSFIWVVLRQLRATFNRYHPFINACELKPNQFFNLSI